MCPDAERGFRDRMRDIDSFERVSEAGPPILAVKKFARNVSTSRISAFSVELLCGVRCPIAFSLPETAMQLAIAPTCIVMAAHCMPCSQFGSFNSLLPASKYSFRMSNNL